MRANEFIGATLTEGGNVSIGDHEAERIDLSKIDRQTILKQIANTLSTFNQAYNKQYGQPLWNTDLYKSNKFLSGSSLHFFDQSIDNERFTKHKNTVGDIDTQVDKLQANNIKEFLEQSTGKHFGSASLIGFKSSAGQYITLWRFDQSNINIQIDLELVDFEKGKPSAWSTFSHSSEWADIESGIKGVFHKYLLRALTTKTLQDVVIMKNKGRGENKTTIPEPKKTTLHAFSVMKGLRRKLKPVTYENGKQQKVNGLPAYTEIPTKDSNYITEPNELFQEMFGTHPAPQDLEKFNSFVGGLDLVQQYFDSKDIQKVILGFAHTLWGPYAQGIYKGNPDLDKKEKTMAFKKMIDVLGPTSDKNTISQMRDTYYENYK